MKKLIILLTTVASLASSCVFAQKDETSTCNEPRETLYMKPNNAVGLDQIIAQDLLPEKCADMVVKMTELNKNQSESYYCVSKK